MTRLVTFGAIAGVVGGALRVVTAFIPFAPEHALLEALYAVVDIGMMFGLIAVYLTTAEGVGMMGLVGFAVSLVGLSSIVGPDLHEFGIDFYRLGAFVFLLGLSILAVQLIRSRQLAATRELWLAAAVAAITFAVLGNMIALTLSGIALGSGFVAAGISIRKR